MRDRSFDIHPTAPVLARIPLLPLDPVCRAAPDGDAEPVVREGMFLAARHLDTDPSETPQLALTARGYDIRARARPTPQGVFVGVAVASLGPASADLRMTAPPRARSNPSGPFLAALAEYLLQPTSAGDGDAVRADSGNGDVTADVLSALLLTTNAVASRRGERWETEGATSEGELCMHTVRATAVTDLILSVCRPGATQAKVTAEVSSRWPQVPDPIIVTTLRTLIRHGFLHTDVWPLDVSADPLGHLLNRLPANHRLRAPLAELRSLLADADTYPPGAPARLRALRAARECADTIGLVDRPFTVDVAAVAHLTVPAHIGRETAEAAGVLWRVADRPSAADAYHRVFLRKYGPHRFVPFLDAADPVIGIGLDPDDPGEPAHDEGPTRDDAARRRDAALIEMVIGAVQCGDREVELDDHTIAVLADHRTPGDPPRTADIHIRLFTDPCAGPRTPTRDAAEATADSARLRVAVSPGGSQNAGSTLGRFASLLGHRHTEPDPDGAILAELVTPSRTASASTLIAPTGFARRRIAIGVPAGPDDLVAADLLLVSNGTRLLVWSQREDRHVVPVLYSRVTPRLLPPHARLLHLVSQSGARPWQTWAWGAAGAGPFQPRVRYRRTVLAPARWVLPADLITAARDPQQWSLRLQTWRETTVPRIADVVVTDDGDRRLPLDLRRPDDQQLLRRYVRRGLLAVTELPGGDTAAHAVVTGARGRHALELTVPLARRTNPPAAHHRAPRPARSRGDGLYLPGSRWLSLAIPAPITHHDHLLARLAAVDADLAPRCDSWFWLRYATPELGPHLRVRFRGDPATLGATVLPAMAAWTATAIGDGLASGLTVEAYDQELERYGGPGCIAHAERVFAADSALALALLANDNDHRVIAAAQAAALITTILADGDRSALDGRSLTTATARERRSRLRPLVRAAAALPPDTGLHRNPAWQRLAHALTDYAATLPLHARVACASSVVHMHANRVVGSLTEERLIRALATDLLARPPRPGDPA